MSKHVMRTFAAIGLVATTLAATVPAAADPPPWAPAHGWRAKKGHHASTRIPFGIDLGRCNRDAIGTLLGGAAGAAAGSTIGKGDGRLVAIAGGAILGALVGGSVGRAMDRADQHCVGQVLEWGETGRWVRWRHPDDGAEYQVMPRAPYSAGPGRYCREYTTRASIGGRPQEVYGVACRQPDGAWQIAG